MFTLSSTMVSFEIRLPWVMAVMEDEAISISLLMACRTKARWTKQLRKSSCGSLPSTTRQILPSMIPVRNYRVDSGDEMLGFVGSGGSGGHELARDKVHGRQGMDTGWDFHEANEPGSFWVRTAGCQSIVGVLSVCAPLLGAAHLSTPAACRRPRRGPCRGSRAREACIATHEPGGPEEPRITEFGGYPHLDLHHGRDGLRR